jgi:hypothetical protein
MFFKDIILKNLHIVNGRLARILRVQGFKGSLYREKIGGVADIFKKNLVIKRTQSENMIRASIVFTTVLPNMEAREHRELKRRIRAAHLCASCLWVFHPDHCVS